MVWQSTPGSWHSKCKGMEAGVNLECPLSGKKQGWPRVLELRDVVQTLQDLIGGRVF